MRTRPATLDDVPALTALQGRWDTHWFGAPEHDESELRLSFDRVDPLDECSRLVLDEDGTPVAAAWWWGNDSHLTVDPGLEPGAVYADLLGWLRAGGAQVVEVLSTDDQQEAALQADGWVYQLSSFELLREVTPDWQLAEPTWPEGVRTAPLGPDDAAAAHDLIYRQAGWAQIPGHGERDLQEWLGLFLGEDVPRDQQVLALEGDRLVGVALGRTFSDGTGWVSQLAVPAPDRGRGLGRALLLEALRRQVDAGAQRLGLGVSAQNPDALRLYLDIGLVVDREWRSYRPA
ncbi:GNAT family N-acetyltransferase [Angustibacter luteus]|uniref:GNAT family N-acetyltransferase n=1 Tax=Angustibacter luteus TaxID=658456 RepID=A0ABW1JIW2_9ACTN